MTIQEAKLILGVYRPSGEDVTEPFFSEALELVQTHDELREWFAGQVAFDAAMGRAFQTELPPAGLRDAILTKKIMSACSTPRHSYNRIAWLCALAAAIVFLVGLNVFFDARSYRNSREITPMSVARFTKKVLDIKKQNLIVLGKENTDPAKLRTWLAERGAPHDFVIPPGLQGIPSLGCQSYLVAGKKVGLICFDLGHNQVAHLFVIEKSALADASSETRPQVRSENGLAFATWTSSGKSFVLTGDNITEKTLRRLI